MPLSYRKRRTDNIISPLDNFRSGLMAFVVSLANTVIHILIDPLNRTQTVINMMDLCGWTVNGIVIAFLQQTVFLLLTMSFLHVLLSMQPYWYGWLTDGILVG